MAAVAAMIGGNSAVLVEGLQSGQTEAINMGAEKRVAMTLEALSSIARYLAGVPGRKNLIWFASSFPVTVFPNFHQREQMSDNRISISQVKKTADLLTASKVAVYPINAEGMANDHEMTADHCISQGVETNCPDSVGVGAELMGNIATEKAERANEQITMAKLAEDTGGKAFYNTNDLDGAMEHAIEDGSHYYTISYTPTNKKMDGNYRKVEVKLTTGKYKLAYRRGYNAADAPAIAPKAEGDPLRPLLAYGRANRDALPGEGGTPVSSAGGDGGTRGVEYKTDGRIHALQRELCDPVEGCLVCARAGRHILRQDQRGRDCVRRRRQGRELDGWHPGDELEARGLRSRPEVGRSGPYGAGPAGQGRFPGDGGVRLGHGPGRHAGDSCAPGSRDGGAVGVPPHSPLFWLNSSDT
jgi:hypothetical protein